MENKITKKEFIEVLDKWIEALRSGNYSQGKEYLFRKNYVDEQVHCCLGVYCSLAVPDIEYDDTQTNNIVRQLTKSLDNSSPEVIVADVLTYLNFNESLSSINDAFEFNIRRFEQFIVTLEKHKIIANLVFDKIIDNSFNSIAEAIDQLKDKIYEFYISEQYNEPKD